MALRPAPANAGKRKASDGYQAFSSVARKRQKTQAIRAIASQSTDAALSATGELNVASFVKAREYEINALERSMQKNRHGLTTRAFQQVPRNMRRRTASHNVKKVPRRLRRRAEKEMKEDNTPTVTSRRRTPSAKMRLRLDSAKRIRDATSKFKSARARKKAEKQNESETDPEARISITQIPKIKKNSLADPPKAISKFKKRQIHKTWLPTHLWHAKRARMTKPSEPLWRLAIPLSPTEKSYRPSHRASGGRGAVAWDMSYVTTIGCEGMEASLITMLQDIGFGGDKEWGAKGKKWRRGIRSSSGWTFESDDEKRVVGPISAIWNVVSENSSTEPLIDSAEESTKKGKPEAVKQPAIESTSSNLQKPAKRKLFLRVHPSAFHQLWIALSKVAKMQRPPVLLEDLRFEIASIDIIGPGSTEALCATLRPKTASDLPLSSSGQTWSNLAGLTNPATLPLGAMLAFTISDPRLIHPRKSIVTNIGEDNNDELTDLIVDWPSDNAPKQAGMFSQKARIKASKCLPSQKAINRRKSLALPGESPPSKDTDPQIPTLLLASRPNTSASRAQGVWTVLLPWKCLDPVWRCLMYYPLSSGGTTRFGGLDETRQIAFERNEPWFPGDFPGTEAGKAWERTESEKRHNVWKRKPPSRRVNYDSLKLSDEAQGEHGKGWACDWEFLLGLNTDTPDGVSSEKSQESSNLLSSGNAPTTELDTKEDGDTPHANAKKQVPPLRRQTTFTQVAPTAVLSIFNPSSIKTTIPALITTPQLATIRITLLTRGTPLPCARIYRLPSPTSPLHSEWLNLDPQSLTPNDPTTSTTKKVKTNWRHDPATASTYPDEHPDLEAINYRPPGMVADAIAQLEKKRVELAAKRDKFQTEKLRRRLDDEVQKAPEGGKDKARNVNFDVEALDPQQREALMNELMRPSADEGKDGQGNGLACPTSEDLIGFVTTGGYNLRVGRGTGIGAIWAQRVLQGWKRDADGDAGESKVEKEKEKEKSADLAGKGKGGSGININSRQAREMNALHRQRRLCIIRNAGETVGRLAIWEVCD